MKKKHACLIIIFLIVVSLAAFGRIAGNDFINFDDNIYITENSYVQSGFNQEGIKWAATAVVSSNWHPLTMLSHTLDWSLFGPNPAGHHLINLLFHIGAVIFLFLFLNKTTNNIWPSAFAAALFALHPLRVESVAWASERKDVLSMFFGMACIYSYAFWAQKEKLSQYLLCLILFAGALMSKPMMVTLPFVLMLLDYWPLQRFPKAGDEQGRALNSLGKLIGEKIPFICLTIASCFITFWAQNKDGIVVSIEKINFFKRFSNAVVSYVAYLVNTFWSVNLAVFYPYELSLPLWKVLTSGIVLILITLAVLYYRKKLPFLFVGWFTYLGTLIPVIGLVQVGKQAMADRYTYLPSIGIALMMAWGIPYLIKSGNIRKKILLPAGIAIIISLSVLTWRQCGYWKDSVSLFNHALSVTKDNAPARNSLGDAFFKKGEFSKALYHFDKAISIDRKYAYAFYNRGVTYAILTQYQRAVEDFNEALRLYPTYASAFHDRGIMYGQMGQYKLAIEDFDNAIRIAPSFAYAYNDRGFTYSKIGRYQRAISDYNNAIRLEPYYTGAYINRGVVYLILGNDTQGCPDAQKACELGNCKILEYAKGIGHCRRFNADQIAKEKR